MKSRLPLAGLLLLIALASVSIHAQSQESPPPGEDDVTFWGRSSHLVPERTDAGQWDGTYYYVNRQQRMAIWVRTRDGVPEMKLRYLSMMRPEGFETDWHPRAEYRVNNAPGLFEITYRERDENTIKGDWDWSVGTGSHRRTEVGQFTVFRSGDGRQLVVSFDQLTRTYHRASGDTVHEMDPAWTFRKASKRLIRWEELPF